MEDCKHLEAHEQRFNSIERDLKAKVSWIVFVWAIGIITAALFTMFSYTNNLASKGNIRDVEMAKIQTQLANIESLLVDIKIDLKEHKTE